MRETMFSGMSAAVAVLLAAVTVCGNELLVSGEAASNGLNIAVHALDGFTDRVEIYSCSNLLAGDWRVAADNLRPVGGAPAQWYTVAAGTGFFIAGNMDIDIDGDGLPDAREKYVHKTNPNESDSDSDGMPDLWEVQQALNPLNKEDALSDPDGDGLCNLQAYQTSPNLSESDTDGDGFIDFCDLRISEFDYPVVGEGFFNLVASWYCAGYASAIGFGMGGEQLLTLRWSDSFWYPDDYGNRGQVFRAGYSQLRWSGEMWDTMMESYRDSYWYWLWFVPWDPPLRYPLSDYTLNPWNHFAPPIYYEVAEYMATNSLSINAPEVGNGFLNILETQSTDSYTSYLCAVFTTEYSEPAPPILLIDTSGKMSAVGGGLQSFGNSAFKFVFNRPVTNKIIKWLTYRYCYEDDERGYVDYAVHQCEVTGKESGLFNSNDMNMVVPTVDLNGDFDSDGDVDKEDKILRAPATASLPVVPTGWTNEVSGNGVVPVTVGANVFAPGMPESVLKLKISGVETGEWFRLWSTTNGISEEPIALAAIGGGGISELIEDPPLLIDTQENLWHDWPVMSISPHMSLSSYIYRYTYAPEFPKTLYLECVSCGATNDGRAKIELVYEYNGEEICSTALPITVIRSKLVPDWNHDRAIDMEDQSQNTNGNSFRFWINDDNDTGDLSEGDSDIPGQGGLFDDANYEDDRVNGRSDLLDFFPVWLDIKSVLERYAVTNGAVYKLWQADGALKFVYTDLTHDTAGDFLVAETNTYGVATNKNACEAATIQITADGVTLNTNFLNRISVNTNKGILMMEAIAPSTEPLVLEIWQGDIRVWETSLAMSLSGVEDMYRWINLRNMQNPGVLTEPSNNPDASSNGKNLVFLHGYQPDVGDSGDMSPWLSEIFKRFYQSGSKAKFHGVLWYSNQGDPMDYQKNVTNAFCTAPVLRDYVAGLDGDVIVAAHSLGNMVVSSAIADQNMSVSKYMMCDAAVASEAYDATMPQDNNLVNEWWTGYSNRTWAANWYQLFADTGDSRTNLTWRNKFKRIVSRTEVFNFYSDGDEVFDLTPNQGLFAGTIGVDANWWFIVPVGVDVNVNFGRFSWQKQELFKGCRYSDGWASFGGTSWAGWGVESELRLTTWLGLPAIAMVQTYTNAAGANMATDEQLRNNPVFEHTPSWLVSAGVLSQPQIDEVLGMGIPALTPSTGRTPIRTSVIPAERQFNLNSMDADAVNFKPNGWPMRGDPDYQNWLHNDMITVACFFNYKLFEEMVESGVLK